MQDELTSKMEQKITVLRDGKPEHLLTRLLVSGDVVLLVEGAKSQPTSNGWTEIFFPSTLLRAKSFDDCQDHHIDFTSRRAVIFLIQGLGRKEFRTASTVKTLVLTCLSIIVAAVPVALPLVLQVTMALGAGKMAREFNAAVTSLPALQDIASMQVLCSDKTGTLTTARITIQTDRVWATSGFTAREIALYAGLASNRDKKEDAIDRSVIDFFDKLCDQEKKDNKSSESSLFKEYSEYTKTRSVGFNPIFIKRVLWEYSHPTKGTITIAKGLPAKVLNTEDGGRDDADDQWAVDNFKALYPVVTKVDLEFSQAGYKTLGVSVKINDGPFQFAGILPMLDPPRHDTMQTVKNLRAAGIKVKMITGDHLNIATETARQIGLGINISAGKELRGDDTGRHTKDEMVLNADGFAQVLPADKREVVMVLNNTIIWSWG